MCSSSVLGQINLRQHLSTEHKDKIMLKLTEKPRKLDQNCTPQSKNISLATKKLTGRFLPMRRLVFNRVCQDNTDLTDLLQIFFTFQPLQEEDIVRILVGVNLSDTKGFKIV